MLVPRIRIYRVILTLEPVMYVTGSRQFKLYARMPFIYSRSYFDHQL